MINRSRSRKNRTNKDKLKLKNKYLKKNKRNKRLIVSKKKIVSKWINSLNNMTKIWKMKFKFKSKNKKPNFQIWWIGMLNKKNLKWNKKKNWWRRTEKYQNLSCVKKHLPEKFRRRNFENKDRVWNYVKLFRKR